MGTFTVLSLLVLKIYQVVFGFIDVQIYPLAMHIYPLMLVVFLCSFSEARGPRAEQ